MQSERQKEDRLIKSILGFKDVFERETYSRLNGELNPAIRRRLESIIRQVNNLEYPR